MRRRASIAGLAVWLSNLVAPFALAQQTDARERTITVENSSSDPLLSPRAYPGVVRESVYIPVRDGVRLAADIFRPARGDLAASERLPLIWTHDRYQRATESDTRRTSKIDAPHLREMVRHGYIVAAVDARGCGASFGVALGPFNPVETADAYDVIEWFARQPWCDGNIGMYGGSYLGATQPMAASTKAPHLKAIIPAMAPGDLYAFTWAGGIFREDFLQHWSALTRRLDLETQPARVDQDQDGALLAQARKDHAANRNTLAQFRVLPFRDSIDADLGWPTHQVTSTLHHLDAIGTSNVAIYHFAGWFDDFTRDALLMYHNLKNPQRIIIGPWFHQQNQEVDYLGEHLRWFDHWLKGIANGIEDEPPIHYYTMGAPPGQRWRSAWEWPLPNEQRTSFFFGAGAKPAAGTLVRTAPDNATPSVVYHVDPTVTIGPANRWANGYGGAMGYGDLADHDARCICFTSVPLEHAVEVTGHPVAHLHVSSTAKDGDFFVYLEEVDLSGHSQYVTEGCLRASHRATQPPPYDYFGLPYHRSYATDVQDLPAAPVELALDLQPTSNVFDAGNRMRITIACTDRDSSLTPMPTPPPLVTLWCNAEHPSQVVLPVIPAGGE